MSMTIDDADLIRSFQTGDHDAFAEIVERYRDELVRHARRRVHDTAAAEDLVQDTFVRAYRAFDRLPCDSQIRPWLHRILENLCIDEAHRRRRELDKAQRAGNEAPLSELRSGPEAELGLDHDDTALATALAELPDTQREALWLRYVDGLDYAEIADGAHTTEVNVRARVSRARSAARRTLTGAASVPLFLFGLVRRPFNRQIGTPLDASGATSTANAVHAGSAAGHASSAATAAGHATSVATTATSTTNAATAAGNAATAANAAASASTSVSSLASSLTPAIELANHAAVAGQSTVPLLTKAAVGVGAIAVAFTAAPETPADTTPAPVAVVVTSAPTTTNAPVAVVPVTAAPSTVATNVAPITVATNTTAAPTTAVTTTTPAPTTVAVAPIVVEAPVTAAPITVAPATASVAVTAAPTTLAPTTTAPPPPPIVGGTLSGSPAVAPSGPRLDVNGGVSLTVAGTASSGSVNGRLGVGEPDPAGARRIDGTLTLSLGSGTIDVRLAGHGSSTEAPVAGVVPTTLTLSGMYRASGATGQLATSGSFNASIANGALSITFSP